MASGVVRGADGRGRCWWCAGHDDYIDYHDTEWGRPVRDDRDLFEKLCLEGFQSGLSWLTILRKRENFRSAFRDFEIDRIVRLNTRSVERLMGDAGIVRHRGKIESVLNNARRARELTEEFGSVADFVWSYRPAPRTRPKRITRAAIAKMASTPDSTALSRELKRRGWTYVGPTTVYAFMQASGMVNDHVEGCWAGKRRRARR